MTTQYINLFQHESKAAEEKRLGMLIRVVEPQPWECGFGRKPEVHPYCTGTQWPLAYYHRRGGCWNSSGPLKSPFGPPGTALHCREDWACSIAYDSYDAVTHHVGEVSYRHGGYTFHPGEQGKWRSADTMPDWAIHFRPTVGEVRCKRAQDVTEEEAKAWGVPEAIRTEQVDSIEQEDFDAIWCPYLTEMRGILEEDLKLIRWEENPWLWLATLTND